MVEKVTIRRLDQQADREIGLPMGKVDFIEKKQ